MNGDFQVLLMTTNMTNFNEVSAYIDILFSFLHLFLKWKQIYSSKCRCVHFLGSKSSL